MPSAVPFRIKNLQDVERLRKSLVKCKSHVRPTRDPTWQWEVYPHSGGAPLGRFRTMEDAICFASMWYVVDVMRRAVRDGKKEVVRLRQMDLIGAQND